MLENNKDCEFYIIKASGERELFSYEKLRRSLHRSGADETLIKDIFDKVAQHEPFQTAKEVYKFVRQFTRKSHPGFAGRYSLKDAIMKLGPTGFPFEKFIGEVFKHLGYSVQLDVIAHGHCIDHELDLVVKKDHEQYMVECKFHNRHGIKTNVTVPLYMKSRFDDVSALWRKNPEKNGKYHKAWIVTNTKLTSNAIKYSECVGINPVSWSYPRDGSLAAIIDRLGLYPVTVLGFLTIYQKKYLIQHGIVLCRQLVQFEQVLRTLHLTEHKIQQVLEESREICSGSK